MHLGALPFFLLMVLCSICLKDFPSHHGLNIHQRKCAVRTRATQIASKRSHEEAIGSTDDDERAPRAAPGPNVNDGPSESQPEVRHSSSHFLSFKLLICLQDIIPIDSPVPSPRVSPVPPSPPVGPRGHLRRQKKYCKHSTCG